MRKGCFLVAIAFVLVACLILYATRSLQIERGLKLDSHVAGDFTYDVWSYGNWIASNQSGVRVSTFAPPYTLVLAIQPNGRTVKSIELLAAHIVDESGNRTPVFEKIKQTTQNVHYRPAAAINSPYAAFVFDSIVHSNDTLKLEIEFRTDTPKGSDVVRQSLTIQGFENRTHSFTFWDVMSSA